MGYHLNRLDEPVFIAVSKPLLTEFDIHHRLERLMLTMANWRYRTVIISFSVFRYLVSLQSSFHLPVDNFEKAQTDKK